MAEVGEVIVNPGTGERIEFRTTRAASDGELLQFELTLAPYGRVGGVPHQHPAEETLEVRGDAQRQARRRAARGRGG